VIPAPSSLDWLFSLAQFGIKFGLHNINVLVAALGHPERQFRSVHVAGTNGKGSVTAIVERSLRSAGLRTGRYTSPHLLNLTERFAIDGVPVTEPELIDAVTLVRELVEHLRDRGTLDVHPTFFEVTTAVAFELFRRRGVAVAVCEVGLGGRLDATNVLSPMATAITSIALDHQQYLGDTLAAIAAEKAGIIKPDVPVVVGDVAKAAADVIEQTARRQDAPIIWASRNVHVSEIQEGVAGAQRFTLRTPHADYGPVTLALAGRHQVGNALVAVRLLEELERLGISVTRHHVIDGLANVTWPARLETVRLAGGREILLDAAHNAAGADALADYLTSLGERRPLVFATMRDKDAASMIAALAPQASRLIVTRASNPRAMEPSALAAIARRVTPEADVDVVDAPAEALAHAWSVSPRIVAAGSIFLLADVMKELGRS
jgi:dihydrofolate synthase / folylpolyglutamate synthase